MREYIKIKLFEATGTEFGNKDWGGLSKGFNVYNWPESVHLVNVRYLDPVDVSQIIDNLDKITIVKKDNRS